MAKKPHLKIAIIYDRVNKWGGAERVLLALHEMFPNAPLYTSVVDSKKAPWHKVFPKTIPSFLQNIIFMNDKHELMGWMTPLAFELFSFDDFDLVITVTSEAAKGIITKPGTLHICYCLTPTRYLWSGYAEYLNNPPSSLSWIPLYKYISLPFLKYVKMWDKIALNRPDIYIAISSDVQKRIKNYYHHNSRVIFPPVDINKFHLKTSNIENERYYLIVGRLVPYKKVDLAVQAFNELNLPLVIVGTGSEEKRLKAMAKSNITFKGLVTEEELIELYGKAKGFVFPQEEDFGIVAVEAQAAGVPVIAYKGGGALDTVIDGETGVFFDKHEISSLIQAIKRFEQIRFEKKILVKNAEKFSKDRFKREFMGLIENEVGVISQD